MKIPKYKILAFDRHMGLITINYEGYEPIGHELPTIDGVYISGEDLDKWARFIFPQVARDWYGVPRKNYSKIAGAEAIEKLVDGTPYPITHNPPEEITQPITTGFLEI